MSLLVFARRPVRQVSTLRRFRPTVERLEHRLAPATATLSAGILTIGYTSISTTAESVTLINDGTNIILIGDVSGSTTNPVASVSKIVVQDSGGSINQKL